MVLLLRIRKWETPRLYVSLCVYPSHLGLSLAWVLYRVLSTVSQLCNNSMNLSQQYSGMLAKIFSIILKRIH